MKRDRKEVGKGKERKKERKEILQSLALRQVSFLW
jgi:hypothetical protein